MGTWFEQVVRMLCVNMQIIASLYLIINIWFQGVCLGKTYRIIDRFQVKAAWSDSIPLDTCITQTRYIQGAMFSLKAVSLSG